MGSKKIRFTLLSHAITLLCLSGCAHTTLSPTAFTTPSIQALGLTALPSVSICIREIPATLGHQYGLVILPLGVIDGGPETSRRIFSELSITAARRGVALKETCAAPRVYFDVIDVAVSAKDALFLRYVSARISANFLDASTGQSIAVDGSASSWRRFGYRAQLDAVFHEAATAAFKKVPFEKFLTLR